ncbi:MAG: hypothetical protein ACRDJC_20330, partial [Thermomicrobiales bacterium]
MKQYAAGTRIVLLVLAALLALPLAPSASPVEAKRRPRMVTRTFGNTAPIVLPIAESETVPASLYPSPIAVRGLKGRIRDVNVRLRGLSYARSEDIEVLLVGPDVQTAIVMANAGGDFSPSEVTLRLDDEASTPLPGGDGNDEYRSGAYRPTNDSGGAIAFDDPAPVASANAALSVFDGGSPNGTWRLYVQDEDGSESSGAFNGGWEIE